MREMGDLSQVPIEPPEQTRLLDSCMTKAGVIGSGVPGGSSLLYMILLLSLMNLSSRRIRRRLGSSSRSAGHPEAIPSRFHRSRLGRLERNERLAIIEHRER